jgi:hypothetical protein
MPIFFRSRWIQVSMSSPTAILRQLEDGLEAVRVAGLDEKLLGAFRVRASQART